MNNTTIDLIRIPVDNEGRLTLDYTEAMEILKSYQEVFPDRQVLIIPANLAIWEDADITTLKSIRDYLNGIIEQKEHL